MLQAVLESSRDARRKLTAWQGPSFSGAGSLIPNIRGSTGLDASGN
jgi:hypothetical protein